MLKHYLWNGKEWQFEAGKQPAGATEIKRETAAEKKPEQAKAEAPVKQIAKTPNKSRKVNTK